MEPFTRQPSPRKRRQAWLSRVLSYIGHPLECELATIFRSLRGIHVEADERTEFEKWPDSWAIPLLNPGIPVNGRERHN